MLVLSRQRGETVKIGRDVDVTVVDVRGDKVRLGINAPRNVEVHRKEIYEAIQRQNEASAGMQPGDVPARPPKPQAAPLPATALATPQTSRLFVLWKDPVSGIESYVLSRRLAPVQQAFAPAGPAFAAGGQYLWFYCAFPPGGSARQGRTLGVVDFREQDTHYLPETQFSAASPLVHLPSGDALWCSGAGIHRRPPRTEGKTVLVNRLPDELLRGQLPERLSTQLTASADGKLLSIDAQVGLRWHIGAAPMDGSAVQIWQTFDRPHSHAQFSPTDPQLMLIRQDAPIDPATLEAGPAPKQRFWLLRPGQKPEPLTPGTDPAPRAHAWWQADGKAVWFVDGRSGAQRVDLQTRKAEAIWPEATGHAHCDSAGQYIVADIGNWETGRRLAFHNTRTGKTTNIVTEFLPSPLPPEMYDIAPHPRFCLEDRYISYTTTVMGHVDVALVPVERLIAATA